MRFAFPAFRGACLLLSLGLGGCAVAAGEGAVLVELADPELVELSGLAPSSQAGRYWGHNDYGNQARLFRLDAEGAALGRVQIRGVANRDWEDLGWLETAGGRCLLIGEIGDNRAQYDSAAIHFLPEPAPGAEAARPAGTLRFVYPQGPRDAEGLAFDRAETALYVLSKRATPPVLYRLPARADCAPASDEVVTAEPVAELILPPPPWSVAFGDPRRGLLFNIPTGLAISRDGRRMAVLTYGAVFVFDRGEGESWADALRREPGRVIFAPMPQAEAIALNEEATRALIGSEGRPGTLQTVALPDFDAQRRLRPQRRELPGAADDQ